MGRVGDGDAENELHELCTVHRVNEVSRYIVMRSFTMSHQCGLRQYGLRYDTSLVFCSISTRLLQIGERSVTLVLVWYLDTKKA